MSGLAKMPGFNFALETATGQVVKRLARVGTAQRIFTAPLVAPRSKQTLGVTQGYLTQVARWALDPNARPSLLRGGATNVRVNGKINWVRVLEITAELLIILGPLLKLAADYTRDRHQAKQKRLTSG